MKIGRIVRVLTDKERKEILNNSDEYRKVVISIFYSVDKTWNTDRQALYSDLFEPKKETFIDTWVANEVDENHLRNLKTNIYNNAPIDKSNANYPVIIYSPGCTFDRDFSTFSIEKLVNEGYIVITIGAVYETQFTVLPNGEVINIVENLKDDENFTDEVWITLREIREQDFLYVINKLETLNNEDEVVKGKLDLSKVGAMGFSLGATAAFEAAAKDNRIKAVVLLEGCLFNSTIREKAKAGENLNTPLVLLKRYDSTYEQMVENTKTWFDSLEDEGFKKELKDIADISETQKLLYEYLNGYKSFVKIDNTNHVTFCDYFIVAGDQNIEYCGGEISVKKAHEIINEVITKFFNEFLCNRKGEYQNFINEKNEYFELKQIGGDGKIL